MRNLAVKGLLLVLPGLMAAPVFAQTRATAASEDAKAHSHKSPKAGTQLLNGTLTVATKSTSARESVEMALEQYETAQYPIAIMHAEMATKADPNFALAWAVLSYSARWTGGNQQALAKARALEAKAAPDEKLLVTFMVGTQEADSLPAIIAMNDLINNHPKDKHVLYLAGEWLFFQGDYARGRKLMEASLEQDPKFAPALNTLGYAYVESLDPQPAKGISLLRRYADTVPTDANPQDSLAEVLRMTGDDEGSLAHYAEALEITPTFITSQYGRGDTYTLMGKYRQAREEYDKALKMNASPHDRLHIEFQKAMVYFWEGNVDTGRAELEKLSASAAEQQDALAQFEIDFARALLAPDTKSAGQILAKIGTRLAEVPKDMLPAERNEEYATVLREKTRLAVLDHKTEEAETLVHVLEALATKTRDQKVESTYESARGLVLTGTGDYADAVDELTSDLHSPLVVQQLIVAQEKLNNPDAAEKARVRLKYLRTPTAEWLVVSKRSAEADQSAAK